MRSIVFCWYFRRCAPILSSFVDRAIATPTSSLSRCCQLPAAAHQKELSIARSVGPAQSCQHNRRGAQWQPSLQPHFTAPWLSTARKPTMTGNDSNDTICFLREISRRWWAAPSLLSRCILRRAAPPGRPWRLIRLIVWQALFTHHCACSMIKRVGNGAIPSLQDASYLRTYYDALT